MAIRRLSLAAAVCLCGWSLSGATDYFVDEGGRGGPCDDAGPGTTAERPLCTLAAAMDQAAPGDHVNLREGRYVEDPVPARDGTAAAPIVIQPFDGETATIVGTNRLAAFEIATDSRTGLTTIERSAPPLGLLQVLDRTSNVSGLGDCPGRFAYTREPDSTQPDPVVEAGSFVWDGRDVPNRVIAHVPDSVASCEVRGARYDWREVVRTVDLLNRRHVIFRRLRFEGVRIRMNGEDISELDGCAFDSSTISTEQATAPNGRPATAMESMGPISTSAPSPAPVMTLRPSGGTAPVNPYPLQPAVPILSVEEGGTGARTATEARVNLAAAADADAVHIAGNEILYGSKTLAAPGVGLTVTNAAQAGSFAVGVPPSGGPGNLDVGASLNMSAGQAIFWPTPTPISTRFFLGTTQNALNGQVDNVICRAYNSDCNGAKFEPTEYVFKDQLEANYDYDPQPGPQNAVEVNWDFEPAANSSGWRPFAMFLDTTANGGDGDAQWAWLTRRGTAYAFEMRNGKFAFNRDTTTDGWRATMNLYSRLEGEMSDSVYGFQVVSRLRNTNDGRQWEYVGAVSDVSLDSQSAATSLGGLIGRRTIAGLSGDTAGRTVNQVIGHQIELNAVGAGHAPLWRGLDVSFDPSGSGVTIDGAVSLVHLATTGTTGPGTTVSQLNGVDVEDLKGVAASGEAIIVRRQTGGSAEGNVALAGGGWNDGHLRLGAVHAWINPATSRLRLKSSAPTSAGDGNVVVTGSGSTSFGPASWAAAGTSGSTACANLGQTCVTAFPAAGGTEAGCSTTAGYRVVMCR